MKVTPSIESVGYGISGMIGGIPRTTYWTPDGRTIKAIPNMREYAIKDKDGKVIKSGTRDANLDNGWLLQKPEVLIPQCPDCAKWHATQAEKDVCKIESAKRNELLAAVIKKDIAEELQGKDNQISEMQKQIDALTELVKQALKQGKSK